MARRPSPTKSGDGRGMPCGINVLALVVMVHVDPITGSAVSAAWQAGRQLEVLRRRLLGVEGAVELVREPDRHVQLEAAGTVGEVESAPDVNEGGGDPHVGLVG